MSHKEPENLASDRPYERKYPWWCLYCLVRVWGNVLFRALFRTRAYCRERVPERGAVILASNHQSYLDPVLIGTHVLRPLCFLARESLFRVPLLGGLIRRLNAFPVRRGGAAARAALRTAEGILKSDQAVVLFPEGTRTVDGKMQPLKSGVYLIARRARCPVVPVLIVGAFEAWPRQRKVPWFSSIRMIFGEPIIIQEEDSSESFSAKLTDAYRRLASELGAERVLREGLGPGESSSPTLSTTLERSGCDSSRSAPALFFGESAVGRL